MRPGILPNGVAEIQELLFAPIGGRGSRWRNHRERLGVLRLMSAGLPCLGLRVIVL